MSTWVVPNGPHVHLLGPACRNSKPESEYFGTHFKCKLRAGDESIATTTSLNVAEQVADQGLVGGRKKRKMHARSNRRSRRARRKTNRR
jgi:hypothetical protein